MSGLDTDRCSLGFLSPAIRECQHEEKVRAYFGTYTVDTQKHAVTHHVEGSLAPEFTDTDQPRPFKLEGDRLEIGDGKTWRRLLERCVDLAS